MNKSSIIHPSKKEKKDLIQPTTKTHQPFNQAKRAAVRKAAHARIKAYMSRNDDWEEIDYKFPGVVLEDETRRPKFTAKELGVMGQDSAILTDPHTEYEFTLRGYSTITASAGGVINLSIPMDPSSSGYNFSEWASLQALFAEVKLVAFRVQFVATFGTATPAGGALPLLIGSSLSVATAPGSYGAVAAYPDSKLWSCANDRSSSGHVHNTRGSKTVDWSLTSSVTAQPYAGVPGAILVYGSAQGVSTISALALVQGTYKFRSRD